METATAALIAMPEDLPPATAQALPEEVKEQARLDLQRVQQDLRVLAEKLRTAADADIPKLNREVQRARVAMMVLREITTDLADPTTYRELTLLNKLVAQVEGDLEETVELEAQKATDRMAEIGVSPTQAEGLVRVLNALMSADKKPALVEKTGA